jgi:hypothetical protein
MDLKENAIELYEREKQLAEENNKREADNFAEKSLHVLRDIIGGNCDDIKVVTKMPGCTDFNVDGVLLRVVTSNGYPVVNIVHTCERCGIKIESRIINLKDIGKALVEPHNKFDCDRIFKLKNEPDYDENGKVTSYERRLLEAMKDFIRENDRMCSGFD